MAVAVVVLAACGGEGGEPQFSDTLAQVKGMVTEVRGFPFRTPEHLVLRDDEGTLWEFSVDSEVNFNTSHIKEHMNRVLPVIVFFEDTADGLTAVRVTD